MEEPKRTGKHIISKDKGNKDHKKTRLTKEREPEPIQNLADSVEDLNSTFKVWHAWIEDGGMDGWTDGGMDGYLLDREIGR